MIPNGIKTRAEIRIQTGVKAMTTTNEPAGDPADAGARAPLIGAAPEDLPTLNDPSGDSGGSNLRERWRLLWNPEQRRRKQIDRRAREIELKQWYGRKHARQAAARTTEENIAFALDARNDDDSRRHALYRLEMNSEGRGIAARVYAEIEAAAYRRGASAGWKIALTVLFIALCAGVIFESLYRILS